MKLRDLLAFIDEVAQEQDLSRPFLVGGIPRDKVAGNLNKFNDIDITTGDNDIHFLAKELSIKLRSPQTTYELMTDGHARIMIGELKLDFSSNFNIPNIDKILTSMGIKNPNSMQKELYSRDFTCNTLLQTMDLKTIQDNTHQAVADIKNKLIKTCLAPEITLGHDHRRVVRVIYLAAKLGFSIDAKIIDWIGNNPSTFADVPTDYLSKKLLKSFTFDKNVTIKLLNELDLWPYVPSLPELAPYIKQSLL